MEDFKILKFIVTLIFGLGTAYLLNRYGGLKFSDSLSISSCFIIVYSFTFIHTMLGQNASVRGSIYNQYQRISNDMRYNIREDRGYIPETLTAGIILFVISLIMIIK